MKADWTITHELAQACGVTMAALVEKGAALVGIQPCPQCKKRSQLLAHIADIGFSQFVKQFKETYGTNNTNTSRH